MCTHPRNNHFVRLGQPNRIWAIPAIHAEVNKLTNIHNALLEHLKPGDRILYLGNYTGHGKSAVECIDELLTFRRLVLSLPAMKSTDIIYLRGAQEEMWQKLLQLQFAPDPTSTLLWMLGNGLSNTLYAYGLSPHDGIEACRTGVMGLTKWTSSIRKAIRKHPGHEIFGTQLQRAAHTSKEDPYPMLFVHTGIDVHKTLKEQGDNFWWAGKDFTSIHSPYDPFQKIIRGFDPEHNGININCVTASIDDGCGFGGNLVCAGFDPKGDIPDLLEA